ncbi:DoxX family protein [Pseudactinotalea suaedae]|uniref:DoxX family protein n=1 Tax=Pseudactinotalea suaedae TaxID=1524924 RepID=UPI0012E2EDE6|nr:DoxX family protein [Pseudactinotalea suaedae]
MLIAYWGLAGSLAAVFLAAGLSKLVRPRAALAAAGLDYVEDFTSGQIKLIGGAEVVGAVGLVLPMLLDIVPLLSPVAACALAAMMVGGVITHVRRDEAYAFPLVLAVLSAAAAALGLMPSAGA